MGKMQLSAVCALLLLGCGSVTESDGTSTAGSSSSGGAEGEQLYVGMGEYDPGRDWHAIMRFDDSEELDSSGGTAYAPDAHIPVWDLSASDGTTLNFAHGLYLNESTDDMYVASIFTSTTPLTMGSPMSDAGSVGVISKMSQADGGQTLARHIFGSQTKLKQPHALWVDESRDILYVANTFGKTILAFEPGSTADGDIAPARTLSHEKLGNPVFVFVDESTDRLFVASMATAVPGMMPSMRSAINIYNNASSADGNREPDIQIAGNNTRLDAGNNQTTHNVWYDASTQLLLAGHHTNELLIYDLSAIDLSPASPTEHDLTPRVLEVHEDSGGSDIGNWSVYGFFHLPENDRLFVSCGHAQMGPTPGAPPNAIKIYDGLLGGSANGQVTPTRVIHWTDGDRYLPAQPLWVRN